MFVDSHAGAYRAGSRRPRQSVPVSITGGTADEGLGDVGTAPPTFDAIFAAYQGPIYGYLLGMVGDAEQARDLAQETFVKAFQALPRMRDLMLPDWLYRIATNTALDALRRRRRVTWLPLSPREDRHADTTDVPALYARREAVQDALAQLTPTQRACLLLRARDGLSIAEIALALDMSEGNVKVTLFRAKERFRGAYAAGDQEPPL